MKNKTLILIAIFIALATNTVIYFMKSSSESKLNLDTLSLDKSLRPQKNQNNLPSNQPLSEIRKENKKYSGKATRAQPNIQKLSSSSALFILLDPSTIESAEEKSAARGYIIAHKKVILKEISQTLLNGNFDPSLKRAKERMVFIDFLGKISSADENARKTLKKIILKPLDWKKPKRLVHMDLMDKLECFEYQTKNDRDFSIEFIKGLSSKRLRQMYITRFVIGLKMSGLEENDAINEAYNYFIDYA